MMKKGIFEKVLKPGFYYYNDCLYEIKIVSLKTQHININGTNQGLLTNDNLTVYLSAVVNYRITDPFLAAFSVENMTGIIDDIASGIIKRLIGKNKIEAIVKNPHEIAEQFRKQLDSAMTPAGIAISFAGIYQMGIPPNMIAAMA